MCSVKQALALSALLLGATIPWVKGEGAETAQGSSSLDREKAAFESRGSLAPSATAESEQTKTPEVLIVLEKEFGIRTRWEDLAEESVAKRLSEILGAISQLRSAKKDEFETTAEFQARRAGLVGNPILDTKQILLLPQSANSTYDADSETLRVDLPRMLFWGPSDVERSRRTVRTTSERPIILRGPADAERPNDATARAFAGDFPKNYFGDAISLVDLKIPRDRARELKPTLRLLVVARFPSPEAPIEDWMTESGRALQVVPTGLLVYSSTDGTVLLRKSFDLPSSLKLLSGEATIQDWLKASPQLREQVVSRIFSGRKAIDASELLLAVVAALNTKQVSSEEPVANLLRVPDLPRPTAPVPVRQTRPKYPFEMRRTGTAGEVIVAFRVREDGSVDDVKVDRSSQKEFEQAAMDCVAAWKFRPALLAGKPVAIYLEVPILFTLNVE